jgi:hypothetical protein
MVSLKLQSGCDEGGYLLVPVLKRRGGVPPTTYCSKSQNKGNKERDEKVSRLQVAGLRLPHPLQIAQVVTCLGVV